MAYQNAIQFWKDFDLQFFQKNLDEEASDIARRQDESDLSVKKLVELSREFKRSTPEDVRKVVSPLLKAFQGEVDALTKRSTSCETMFLNTYRKLIEIPNPVPLFEQALSQQNKLMKMQDVELENKKLRETLDEYTREFAQVKNQEATITKLRNQIKELESSIETKAAAKAAEIEHQLTESFREKEKNLENTVLVSKQKLEESLSNNSILQSALEATQLELFELKTKLDDESSAKGAELDILMTDLDRANQRALTAEKKLEKYHEESQSMTSHIPQKTMVDTTSLELELQAKDRELVNVRGDVERLQRNVKSISESSTSRIESLEEQLAAQSLRVKELEKIMQEQSDYHEIKKELNILRTVEFSSSTSEVTSTTLSKPLEVLLLEKNKGLVSENTGLKTELAELRSHFATLQTECNESHQTIFDQRSLISRLESDLANIRPFLPPRTEAEGQSSSTNIISEAVKDITTDGDDKASHDSDSLLNIVTNQRERFKVLNQQLESECLEQRQTIGLLQKEMDTLRTDNVNMYEKIRFLQSYQGVGNRGVDDTSTRRYSNQYEAKLDPFTAFSVKERQRKYQQLSGPDKATLILGRFILSNKVARLATLVYLIAVHLIIVLVLANLANNSETSSVDLYTECAKKFSDHMSFFHSHELPRSIDNIGNG